MLNSIDRVPKAQLIYTPQGGSFGYLWAMWNWVDGSHPHMKQLGLIEHDTRLQTSSGYLRSGLKIPMLEMLNCRRSSSTNSTMGCWANTLFIIFSSIQASIHSSTLSINSDTRSTLIPSKFDSVSRNLGRSQQRQDLPQWAQWCAVTNRKATMF